MQTHSKQYSSYFVLKTNTADNVGMHVHMRTIRDKNTMCECTLFKEHYPLLPKPYNNSNENNKNNNNWKKSIYQ